jgi:hypothetical protein
VTATTEVDWTLAEVVADRLGAATREIVARRNPGEVQEWARSMSSSHVGEGKTQRSLSYFELAVVAGDRPGKVAELRKPWVELLQEAEKLTATVRGKVKAEAQAEAEAKRKAEDEKRKAEKAEVVSIASDEDEETGA